jgi:hypothetical protein
MEEHPKCPNCGSQDDKQCLGAPRNEEAVWTDAFYDRDYQRDQTRRMVIVDRVVEFLSSIGCRITWTAGHDGSDFDLDYGIYIASVIYKGAEYRHNPCYRVNCEFPFELLRALDARFADVEETVSSPSA